MNNIPKCFYNISLSCVHIVAAGLNQVEKQRPSFMFAYIMKGVTKWRWYTFSIIMIITGIFSLGTLILVWVNCLCPSASEHPYCVAIVWLPYLHLPILYACLHQASLNYMNFCVECSGTNIFLEKENIQSSVLSTFCGDSKMLCLEFPPTRHKASFSVLNYCFETGEHRLALLLLITTYMHTYNIHNK